MNDRHASSLECFAIEIRAMSLVIRYVNRDTGAGGGRIQLARIKIVARTFPISRDLLIGGAGLFQGSSRTGFIRLSARCPVAGSQALGAGPRFAVASFAG